MNLLRARHPSTQGIRYAHNSGAGTTSSDVNSQINALGVGVEMTAATTIETTRPNLDFSVSSGTSIEQTGVWFGLDEDNYLTFVISKTDPDAGSLELAVEQKPSSGDAAGPQQILYLGESKHD